MILHRYFAKRFTIMLLGVLGVFVMTIMFIELVEQLRRYSGVDAGFQDVLTLTLLKLPQSIYGILPLIMVISAVSLFLSLARSSEMVVTRAAGRSAMRALVSPILVALIFGMLAVAVLNPIVAATSRQYEARVDRLLGESSILSLGASGLWLRQGTDEGQTVIRAGNANLNGTSLRNVTFLTFGDGTSPTRRIEAARARLVDGAWIVSDAKVWDLGAGGNAESGATQQPRMEIPSSLTASQIRDSFGTPSSIPIWDLPAFIARLKAAGFSAQRHQVWFQLELATPICLVAMVMIGATFTLRHQRGGRTGLMVLFAILLSFALYFVRNFTQVLGENGDLPAVLAAWAPPLAAIGLSLGMLLHLEDG